jgi:hypothetical protein
MDHHNSSETFFGVGPDATYTAKKDADPTFKTTEQQQFQVLNSHTATEG